MALLSHVIPKSNRKIQAAFLAVAVLKGLWDFHEGWKSRQKEGKCMSLKFEEGTDAYQMLIRWISRQTGAFETKDRVFDAHFVGSSMNLKMVGATPEGASFEVADETPPRWLLVPKQADDLKFEGVRIKMESSDTQTPSEKDYRQPLRSATLLCETQDLRLIHRLLDEIALEETSRKIERHPQVYARSGWGDWQRIRPLPGGRSPVLPCGVLEDLTSDFGRFLQKAEWYYSVGVPWRRGYLLHGVPGSGKTTTAIALAEKFKKDIYVISLSGISDNQLLDALRRVDSDGIALIEDIDCAKVTHDRGGDTAHDPDKGLSLSGLLNALDGAVSPDGRVVIASTNYKDKLDSALLRRFDRHIEFHNATSQQIILLAERFGCTIVEQEALAGELSERASMATVQERLIEMKGLI